MSQMGFFVGGGPTPPSTAVETLTGNVGGPVPPTLNNINILGDAVNILVTGNPGTSTLTISNAGGLGETITGNTGGPISPIAGNWNIVTFGTNVLFSGAGNTLTLDFNQSNILLGATGGAITTGVDNTGLGLIALASITSGSDNTAIGYEAMEKSTTSSFSTAVGSFSMFNATAANNNTAIGYGSLVGLATGTNNTALGYNSGAALTTGDSNNILISNNGIVADNGVIRIGTNGTHIKTFVAGIDGVNVGSTANVVTEVGDQLGTAVLTAGSGITITPTANVITIAGSGTSTLTYTNVNTTPYVVLTTDQYLGVDSSGAPITIQLPNAPAVGRTFTIKDRTGSAFTNNITVTTVGGVVNIDGATTFVMNTAYEAINVLFDGTTYQIF